MKLVFSLLILFLPFSLFGLTRWEKQKSPFAVKITISTENLTLKESLTVELSTTFPKGYSLDADIVRSHLLKQSGFEEAPFKLIKETVYPPAEIAQNLMQQRFVYELDPLLTGTQYVSFFHLPFQKDKQTTDFFTYIFPITISEGEEEKIEVMRAPLMNFDLTLPIALSPENRRHLLENPEIANKEIARNQRRIEEKSIPWLGILMVILASIFVALALKKEEKPETEAEKQEKIKTLKEHELDVLSKIPIENADTFYVEMTNVVRDYIEKKFGIPVSSKTTEEFMHDLKGQTFFSQSEQYLLEDFLTHSDRVKFAQYAPTQKEKENALNAAKKFIVDT